MPPEVFDPNIEIARFVGYEAPWGAGTRSETSDVPALANAGIGGHRFVELARNDSADAVLYWLVDPSSQYALAVVVGSEVEGFYENLGHFFATWGGDGAPS